MQLGVVSARKVRVYALYIFMHNVTTSGFTLGLFLRLVSVPTSWIGPVPPVGNSQVPTPLPILGANPTASYL